MEGKVEAFEELCRRAGLKVTPQRVAVYKVLVGPLNQDESGALLYKFRVKGFPDAFVRAGAVN